MDSSGGHCLVQKQFEIILPAGKGLSLFGHRVSSIRTHQMKVWSKFAMGIDYGYGLVRFRTIPLLMPPKYNIWGNFGSTGSFLFYQPDMDLYLMGTFNQFRTTQKAIRFMLKTIDMVSKMK
ncbi:MAG: hypothetical protein ACQEXX_21920 [Bacillota bacterium]